MEDSANLVTDDIQAGWPERGALWQTKSTKSPGLSHSRGQRQPLILSGHGMRLRINHGALEAQNGFTHYPQKQEITRIFPGDREVPSRIVMLGNNGAITLSVLSWLAEQNIPLLQLDYRGNVVAAIGHSGIGHDSALVRLQIAASETTAQNRELGAWLIRKKLLTTRDTMLACLPDSDLRKRADTSITEGLRKLNRPWELPKEALLGVEGKCATLYFDAWRTLPISWKGTSRKPIPESWLSIGVRRGPANHSNRFARHPVQAMLNYGYAAVESQLRIETAKVGLDMTVGFLHQSRYERPALIMDLIEPIRATVDRIVLDMIRANSFSPVDFTISQDGVVRLHPQLGRALVAQIGTPKSIEALISAFLTQIGFKLPELSSGRGQTWMAQRALKRGNAVDQQGEKWGKRSISS